MHGLINRSFECFLRNTYGAGLWAAVVRQLDPGFDSFEPMFSYDDALTQRMIDIAAERLDKPREDLLEDFGTYLVAHPASERVRRLLRFGGVDYEDFLLSLEDLRGRARLAVPDLDLPLLELTERGAGAFTLSCKSPHAGFGPVFLGLLRALADDYGALAFLDYEGRSGEADRLQIRVYQADFAEARGFALAEQASG